MALFKKSKMASNGANELEIRFRAALLSISTPLPRRRRSNAGKHRSQRLQSRKIIECNASKLHPNFIQFRNELQRMAVTTLTKTQDIEVQCKSWIPSRYSVSQSHHVRDAMQASTILSAFNQESNRMQSLSNLFILETS